MTSSSFSAFEESRISEFSAAVIDIVGSDSFFPKVSKILERMMPYEGLIIFLYRGTVTPSSLVCTKSAQNFQAGLKNYLTYTYVLNPVYRAFQKRIKTGAYLITDLMPEGYLEQITNSELRIRIEASEVIGYRTPGWPKDMTDVLGLVQLPDSTMIEFDFITSHLDRQTGRCLSGLKSIFPVVASAVRKHFEFAPQQFLSGETQPGHESQFQDFANDILTDREQSVVKLILTGHSSQSIALTLEISLPTVKSHRRNAYTKLNISSQAELFNLFIQSLVDSAA